MMSDVIRKYLTYKEWKHCTGAIRLIFVQVIHSVSTLPIRNGNNLSANRLTIIIGSVSTLPIRNGNIYYSGYKNNLLISLIQ